MTWFEKNAPKGPLEEATEQLDEKMKAYDLFGVADLLCKNNPNDWPKIVDKSVFTGALIFHQDGTFDFRVGDSRFRSVTVSPEACQNRKK